MVVNFIYTPSIAADKTSEIIINGGTVRGADYTLDTRVAEYLYRRDCAIASYGKLTINGGEFTGIVGIIGLPDGNDVDVTINGGVFNNCVQVDAELTATDTFLPRIAIYGGNFKDRFVVNPGVKGISGSTKFYIPICCAAAPSPRWSQKAIKRILRNTTAKQFPCMKLFRMV